MTLLLRLRAISFQRDTHCQEATWRHPSMPHTLLPTTITSGHGSIAVESVTERRLAYELQKLQNQATESNSVVRVAAAGQQRVIVIHVCRAGWAEEFGLV